MFVYYKADSLHQSGTSSCHVRAKHCSPGVKQELHTQLLFKWTLFILTNSNNWETFMTFIITNGNGLWKESLNSDGKIHQCQQSKQSLLIVTEHTERKLSRHVTLEIQFLVWEKNVAGLSKLIESQPSTLDNWDANRITRRVWRYQTGNQNPYIKKNRQHNGQKYKRTNNDLQNIHIKLKIA